MYFALVPGVVIPAWQQITFTEDAGAFTTIVDAVSGTLLWRKNIQSHASTPCARAISPAISPTIRVRSKSFGV